MPFPEKQTNKKQVLGLNPDSATLGVFRQATSIPREALSLFCLEVVLLKLLYRAVVNIKRDNACEAPSTVHTFN